MTRLFPSLIAAALIAVSGAALADNLKVVKKVPPEFPGEAARKGITEGVLKASLVVDEKGAVSTVTIVEASPAKAKIFTEAAVEALKQWKFEAPGKATTIEMKLVFQQD
jgi:TonB family protein